VLQCVAVRCSVLQCVVLCCSVLQCVAVRRSALQCVEESCSCHRAGCLRASTNRGMAVCCSVLQCVAVCCSALQLPSHRMCQSIYRGVSVYCGLLRLLRCAMVCSGVLQCVAVAIARDALGRRRHVMYYEMLKQLDVRLTLQHAATRCNTLQYAATHCITMATC